MAEFFITTLICSLQLCYKVTLARRAAFHFAVVYIYTYTSINELRESVYASPV